MLAPFSDTHRFANQLAIFRVFGGLFFTLEMAEFHSAIAVTNHPALTYWVTLVAIALGACLTVGLLTSLTCLLLISFHAHYAFELSWSLNNSTHMLLCWAFLFGKAGKTLSLDSLVTTSASGNLYSRWKSKLLPDPSPSSLTFLRFLLYLSLGGMIFPAVLLHVRDPYWKTFQAFPLLLTSPFINAYAEAFVLWAKKTPVAFGVFASLSQIGFLAFQALLLPAAYHRVTRPLVIFTGFAFFIGGWFLIGLGYFCVYGCLLWMLIHPTAPCPTTPKTAPPVGALRFFGYLVGFNFAWCAVINLTLFFHPTAAGGKLLGKFQVLRVLTAQMDMRHLNVYNASHIEGAQLYFTLWKKKHGRETLVEAVDLRGARSSLLRNELIYKKSFSKIQSFPMAKYDSHPGGLNRHYLDLMSMIATMDRCYHGEKETAYRARLMKRHVQWHGAYFTYTQGRGVRELPVPLLPPPTRCWNSLALGDAAASFFGKDLFKSTPDKSKIENQLL